MKILFLGFSSIVERRVMPAVFALKPFTQVELASRRGKPKASQLPGDLKAFYVDFDEALSKSRADLVYVSTVNAEHAQWVGKALRAGFHVVVDKPAFTDLKDAKRLVNQARDSNRVLAESMVYHFHPQVQLSQDIFLTEKSEPTRIFACFCIPPLAKDNFRYKKNKGGGALHDLGPYAVSVGRVYFKAEPQRIVSLVNSLADPKGGPHVVETAFSVLMEYPGGKSLAGHFGFDTEYRNELILLGRGVSITIDRIFTTPADLENNLKLRIRNEASEVKAPAADPFGLFFLDVISAIEDKDYQRFSQNLLDDARLLSNLKKLSQ